MLLFVAADFLRRRRKPARPVDDVPTKEFFDLLAFWALLGVGGFCAAVGGFAIVAVSAMDAQVDYRVVIALAIVAIVCINRAFVFWWRIRG